MAVTVLYDGPGGGRNVGGEHWVWLYAGGFEGASSYKFFKDGESYTVLDALAIENATNGSGHVKFTAGGNQAWDTPYTVRVDKCEDSFPYDSLDTGNTYNFSGVSLPSVPTNLTESDISKVGTTGSFSWDNGAGATHYEVQLNGTALKILTPATPSLAWHMANYTTTDSAVPETSYTLAEINETYGFNDFDLLKTDGTSNTWRVSGINKWGYSSIIFDLWSDWGSFTIGGLPEKAVTPGPTNANSDVTLDQNDLTWIDGGFGAENEATHFSVYYGDTSGDLTLVSDGQTAGGATNSFIIWELLYGSPFDYAVTRYWRVDSTNEWGTTTGDEWSFTTLTFAPPGPSPPDPDPDDPYPIDYEFDPNFIRTTQRLTLASGHQFWYEIS